MPGCPSAQSGARVNDGTTARFNHPSSDDQAPAIPNWADLDGFRGRSMSGHINLLDGSTDHAAFRWLGLYGYADPRSYQNWEIPPFLSTDISKDRGRADIPGMLKNRLTATPSET